MELSFFRRMKWLNIILCLVFCLTIGFSNCALAFDQTEQ